MSSLRDELQQIYEARGRLRPKDIVAEAEAPSHPLHSRFEWDDSVAGHKYRLEQARELIRSVRVTFRSPQTMEKTSVRAYVARTDHTEEPGVYIATEEALSDPLVSRILFAELEREIRQLRERYGHLKEFKDIVARETGIGAA